MRDSKPHPPDDWREKADQDDEQRPNAREQRDILLGKKKRTFHPLNPDELEQRRIRRGRGRAEQEGPEAA